MIKNFLCILLVTFLIVGCSQDVKYEGDEEVMEGFLKVYYSQLTLTSEDWDKVKEDMDKVITSSDEETIEFMNNFSEFLTEPCLEQMISNRLIPNLYMEETDIESVTIQNLELIDQGEGQYNVSYILKIKKNNQKEEFENNQEIRMVTIDNKRFIDSIVGEFVWDN